MSNSPPINDAFDLSKLPLLDNLNPNQFDLLKPRLQILNLAKNAYLFKPGEISGNIFVLLKGNLKHGIWTPNGKEQMQSVVCPMEILGLDHIMGHPKRRHYAKVLGKQSSVLVMPIDSVYQLMKQNNEFALFLLNIVAERLKKSENMLQLLLTADVRTRIMHFLGEIGGSADNQAPLNALLQQGLTQQEIAQIIGSTRQTVALVIQELRKAAAK